MSLPNNYLSSAKFEITWQIKKKLLQKELGYIRVLEL